MKRNKISKILALLMACVMMFALVGCGGNNAGNNAGNDAGNAADKGDTAEVGSNTQVTEETKFQKKITIATSEAVNCLDPSGSTGPANLILFWMSHSTLIDIDPITGEITCDACESYEQVSDTMWQFNLRKGVKFHNGEEMKASDVVFTFERARESTYLSDRTEWIKDVKATDDYTVQIELVAPAQDILFYFSFSAFSIVSEVAVKADPEEGTLIGTGPYVVADFELGNYTNLTRFEDYFGEEHHTEEFTFRVMPEASTRLVALQTGEVDICVDPAAVELNHIRDDKNLVLLSRPSEKLEYLALNLTNDKFKDQRVRQAIAYAINKDSVLTVAAEGNGEVAKTFFSSGWGQATDLEGYNYDVEKSKALLAEAGVSDLEFTIYAYDGVKAMQAQVIQENLAAVGIKVNIEEIELAALKPLMVEGNFDGSLYNWANDSAGPDNNVRPILRSGSGSNRSHFSDKYIDDLMDAAMIEADSEKRLEMYHEIQEYVLDQAPIIPLYYTVNYIAVKAGLENLSVDPSNTHRFAQCYIIEK